MRFKGLGLGVGFVLLSAVALVAQYAPYYVLDGYGGVHAGGGAPAITPATPYFGWDIAKALDFRRIDPQAYGTAPETAPNYTDTSWHTLAGPINIVLPDAGYVLVTGNLWVINATTTAGQSIYVEVGIGVNSEAGVDSVSTKACTIQAEELVSGLYNNAEVAVSRLFYFDTSGTQRFYLLGRRAGGTGTFRAAYPCFNAVYFNKRWDTYSMSPRDEDLALAPNISQAESPSKVK
jgi:hypothetical protein